MESHNTRGQKNILSSIDKLMDETKTADNVTVFDYGSNVGDEFVAKAFFKNENLSESIIKRETSHPYDDPTPLDRMSIFHAHLRITSVDNYHIYNDTRYEIFWSPY